MDIKIHDHILPNGRKFVGTDEDLVKQFEKELKEINERLAILKSEQEKDILEFSKNQRKLWGY